MTCPKHDSPEEFSHCNRLTLFERVATDAKAVLEARQKLMNLMGMGQAWDDQQAVVQSCVKSLEESVRDADIAGVFGEPIELRKA